jgi:hypothetical protein
MSAPGVVNWLGAMGVREFTTLLPSDLEYDPRLVAIAEWRNVRGLIDYRLDNVILDVLLEVADEGARLSYPWYRLPVARLLKAWSVGQALVGAVPTIPKGMTASAALRIEALTKTIHPLLRREVEGEQRRFRDENGYEAPYWVLVELARQALVESRADLSFALTNPPSM